MTASGTRRETVALRVLVGVHHRRAAIRHRGDEAPRAASEIPPPEASATATSTRVSTALEVRKKRSQQAHRKRKETGSRAGGRGRSDTGSGTECCRAAAPPRSLSRTRQINRWMPRAVPGGRESGRGAGAEKWIGGRAHLLRLLLVCGNPRAAAARCCDAEEPTESALDQCRDRLAHSQLETLLLHATPSCDLHDLFRGRRHTRDEVIHA